MSKTREIYLSFSDILLVTSEGRVQKSIPHCEAPNRMGITVSHRSRSQGQFVRGNLALAALAALAAVKVPSGPGLFDLGFVIAALDLYQLCPASGPEVKNYESKRENRKGVKVRRNKEYL